MTSSSWARTCSHTWDLSEDILFFYNETATTELYTLSLHDALPIFVVEERGFAQGLDEVPRRLGHGDLARDARERRAQVDRKSTRLNSSHVEISYAVFCLKKKRYPNL